MPHSNIYYRSYQKFDESNYMYISDSYFIPTYVCDAFDDPDDVALY